MAQRQVLSNARLYEPSSFIQVLAMITFRSKKIEIVLLNSDREFDLGLIVSLYARLLRVDQGLLLPDRVADIGACSSIRNPLESNSYFYRLGKLIYPENFAEYQGLLYSYYSVLNFFLVSINPNRSANPWYEGYSGRTKFIYSRFPLNSVHIRQFMLLDKVVERVLDEASEFVRNNVCTIPNKEILLALPQFWEQGIYTRDEAQDQQIKLIEILLNKFSEVHISLHPRMDISNYGWLKDLNRVIVVSNPLFKILHEYECLACINSSVMYYMDILDRDLIVFRYSKLDYSGLEKYLDRQRTKVVIIE